MVVLQACDDGGTENPGNPNEQVLSGAISENRTLTADKIWEIQGKAYVESGVTLTIEPGTIIKGQLGTGSAASALVIARGGKIEAKGTAAAPIIFTSAEDNIQLGQLIGTNLGSEDKELWGGLIILGNAPVSTETDDTEGQIEGIPAEEGFGRYGGTNANDNSGTIEYVSVRHGGVLIVEGNEINGITLGGVGAGTTISNVEVFATLDDGIEFFGGTVNVTNAIVSYQGDDGLDIDQNYAGTVDNFVIYHGGTDTDEGLEIDGPEGETYTEGLFTLQNGLIASLGGVDGGTPADLKSKAQGTIKDVIFSGYEDGDDLLKVRASYSNDCADASEDAWLHLTDASSNVPLKLMNSNFTGVEVYTASKNDDESADCTVSSDDQTAADNASVPSSGAAGANTTVFASWTAASINGLLDN